MSCLSCYVWFSASHWAARFYNLDMQTMDNTIKLSRSFRPIVLSALKSAPGWPEYMANNALDSRSHKMTRDEVIAACAALGMPLADMWTKYQGENGVDAEHENDAAPDAGDIAPDAAPVAPAPIASAGFEGRDARELIAEALAPASIHMTAHLAGMLPGLLAPIAAAATAGPRTIVKTVVKHASVDAGAPSVNVTRRVSVGEAFGVKARDKGASAFKRALENTVSICDCDDVAVDNEYVWTPELVAMLGVADAQSLNVWLSGPAGVGKTEGMAQYAARLRRPFVRIAINRTTEPVDLLGQMLPTKEGGAAWRDGILTRAFRTPFAVVLLDEPTLLRSGTLAVFQTALDTRKLYLPTGEVVDCAEGVFFAAADNTSGVGDETGRYVDTAPINVALLDRFALRVTVDYLDIDRETDMLAKRSGLDRDACKTMCEYAGLTRSNADSGKLTIGVTPRRLLAWARAVCAGVPSDRAFVSTIIVGADPTDKETLIMLEGQNLKSAHAQIDRLARGETIDLNAPAPSTIGVRFPDDQTA